MKRRIIFTLFIFICCWPGGLRADEEIDFSVACPSAQQIDPYIMGCGHNKFVALQGRYCAEELVAAWTESANQLIPILQGRGKISNQNRTVDDAARDYYNVSEAIRIQIGQMQRYTAVIEQYPMVMIDLPDSTGDETSMGCFNDAFHHVQEIITFLDDEIIRAKQVRKAAITMMNASAARSSNLSTSLGGEAVTGLGAANPLLNGTSPRSASTITGEIKEMMLNSKNAASKLDKKFPRSASPPFVGKVGPNGDRDGVLASFSPILSWEQEASISKQNGGGKPRAKTAGKSNSVGSSIWNEGDGKLKISDEVIGRRKGRTPASIVYKTVPSIILESCEAEASAAGPRTFAVVARFKNSSLQGLQKVRAKIKLEAFKEGDCSDPGGVSAVADFEGEVPSGEASSLKGIFTVTAASCTTPGKTRHCRLHLVK